MSQTGTGQPPPPPPPAPPTAAAPPPPPQWGWSPRWRYRRGWLPGTILIVLGVFFLLHNLGLLDWLSWSIAWPLVLIVVGILLLWRRWS